MTESWLKPNRAWLSEYAERHDLMASSVDDDVYGGDLAALVHKARGLLGYVSGAAVLATLRFADAAVSDGIEHGLYRVTRDGNDEPLSSEMLDSTDPTQIIAPIAGWLSGNCVTLIDDAASPPLEVEVTGASLYAALALSEAMQVVQFGRWGDWLGGLGARYAMTASRALTIAEALDGRTGAIAALTRRAVRSEAARNAALSAQRIDSRGKVAGKVRAKEIWELWEAGSLRQTYRSQAALARHIVDVTALESTKHVEELIREWRRAKRQ